MKTNRKIFSIVLGINVAIVAVYSTMQLSKLEFDTTKDSLVSMSEQQADNLQESPISQNDWRDQIANWASTLDSAEPEIKVETIPRVGPVERELSRPDLPDEANIELVGEPEVHLSDVSNDEYVAVDLAEIELGYATEPGLEIQFSESEPEVFGIEAEEIDSHNKMLEQQLKAVNELVVALHKEATEAPEIEQRRQAINQLIKNTNTHSTDALIDIAVHAIDANRDLAINSIISRLTSGADTKGEIVDVLARLTDDWDPIVAERAVEVLKEYTQTKSESAPEEIELVSLEELEEAERLAWYE